MEAPPLGLVAGRGRLPLELARAARRGGRRVVAVAFRDQTDPALEAEVDALSWLYLGELGRLVDSLGSAGVREAVLAGKIAKTEMYRDPRELHADARALALLAGLGDRRDDAILGALADHLEAEGIRLSPQAELVPQLLAPEGRLGRLEPTALQWEDVALGWRMAKAIGGLDIGQAVIVRERAVLAVEAIEGTDAAIRRAGKLGGQGACVVKVAKPKQDPRFDLPTVGLDTLRAMRDAGAGLLAVEAGQTLVLDREAWLREADAAGIVLLGVGPGGPPGAGAP